MTRFEALLRCSLLSAALSGSVELCGSCMERFEARWSVLRPYLRSSALSSALWRVLRPYYALLRSPLLCGAF